MPSSFPDNHAADPRGAVLRWFRSILNGSYDQQHKPLREQSEAVGHAIRFGCQEIVRKPWYVVPCCPPNIARTSADLGTYLVSDAPGAVLLHQYVGSEAFIDAGPDSDDEPTRVHWKLESGMPWDGEARLEQRRAHPGVRGHRGKVAITRGPLVYCLESVDNPDVDIFADRLDPASLAPVSDPGLLDGAVSIQGSTSKGRALKLIPYLLWGNRGPSDMTDWINT